MRPRSWVSGDGKTVLPRLDLSVRYFGQRIESGRSQQVESGNDPPDSKSRECEQVGHGCGPDYARGCEFRRISYEHSLAEVVQKEENERRNDEQLFDLKQVLELLAASNTVPGRMIVVGTSSAWLFIGRCSHPYSESVLERVVARSRLDCDPAQLSEFVHRSFASKPAVSAGLDAPERHLCLVVYGRSVHVAHP